MREKRLIDFEGKLHWYLPKTIFFFVHDKDSEGASRIYHEPSLRPPPPSPSPPGAYHYGPYTYLRVSQTISFARSSHWDALEL